MKVKVICGALVVKGNKFVLVKEAKKHVYGKWNFPAGHLELDDDIFQGTKKEVKEETNLDVKLDGLIGVYEHKTEMGNNSVKFIFKASVIKGTLKHAKGELLEAKWFSFEEFSKLKDKELRSLDMKKVVGDYKKRALLNLDIINIYGF